MKIRLYFDEDSMHKTLVEALRARGVDVITALQAGMIERPDEEHLETALLMGYVLFSFNIGDYYRLHNKILSEGKEHAGIILAKQQHYSVGEMMRRISILVATLPAEETVNRDEFLSAWK